MEQTLSQQIAEVMLQRKASLMVTNIRNYFVLCNEDGTVADLTPTGRARRFYNLALATARAKEIITTKETNS